MFARARENARKSSCLNNLKQIGQGMLQYVQDYDECLPNCHNGANNRANVNNNEYQWEHMVYPYIKSDDVFYCPSGDQNTKFKYARVFNVTANGRNWGSYSINASYYNNTSPGRRPPTDQPGKARNISALSVPTETVWVCENTTGGFEFYWQDAQAASVRVVKGDPDYIERQGETGWRIPARHLGTTGVLFCDGHVKAVQLDWLITRNSGGALKYFTIEDD